MALQEQTPDNGTCSITRPLLLGSHLASSNESSPKKLTKRVEGAYRAWSERALQGVLRQECFTAEGINDTFGLEGQCL